MMSSKPQGQQPEALAEFAESSRKAPSEAEKKNMTADEHTEPLPTSNEAKEDVATRILNEGAKNKKRDPKDLGADELPDRIIESR